MNFIETEIKDLILIVPEKFGDNRGWFFESYNYQKYSSNGITTRFVQDNHSLSVQKGVLRGMHFQLAPYAQSKLVRCTRGKIYDVAIDLRKNSPTYLKWFGVELSDENQHQLFIPKGFAHGFITLSENCEVQYKVDEYYNKESDRSIRYDDPIINIKWPIEVKSISEKDKNAPFLAETDVNF